MATEVQNNIIGVEKATSDLTNALKPHVEMLGKTVQMYAQWSKEAANVPTDLINKVNQMAAANEKLYQSQKKVTDATVQADRARKAKADADIKELDILIKKLKAESDEIQLQIKKMNLDAKKAKQANDIANGLEKEVRALERANNVYNKIQAKINTTTQAYNNLAAKKSLGIDLTVKEERMLNLYTVRLSKYGGILKEIDANIGKHQRNVGNYSSAWNGMQNAVNQLTREMPAFTYSIQTGFMAISNNIPALMDEISALIAKNKELRTEGGKTKSVIGTIAGALFSWQTVLSVLITLSTVYAKEIGEFFSEIWNGSKKISAATVSLNAYKDALKGGEYQKAYTDVQKVGMAFEEAKKGTISKKEALETYNNTLGDVMGKTNDFNKAEHLYIKNSDKYIAATLAMASANYLFSKSAELNAQRLDLQTAKIGWFEKTWSKTSALLRGDINASLNSTTLAVMRRGEKIGKLNDELEANAKGIKNFFDEYEKNSKNMNMDNFFGGDDKDKKKKEKVNEIIKQRIQSEYELKKVTLERQKAEAEFAEDSETMYLKQIELAELERKNKEINAKLEIKDAETLKNTLKKIEQEYLSEIEDINRSEIKDEEGKQSKVIEAVKKFYDLKISLIKQRAEESRKARALEYEDDRFEKEKEILKLKQEIETEQEGTPQYYAKLLELRQKEYEYDKMHLKYLIATEKDPVRKKELENALKTLEETFNTDTFKILKEATSSFEKGLSDIFNEAGFEKIAELLDGSFINSIKNIKDWKDAADAAMKAVGAISQEVFAGMKRRSDAYYENEFAKLEKEKEVALKYYQQNTAGREALEEKYDQRRRQLKRQQAKQEKDMAIFEAIINIATGVTASLAQGGWVGIVLAALIAGLGAVQIAAIASQPLPAFWKGTQNAPEGWAIVDELRPEIHTDKKGKIKSMGSKKGANLRYLEKGDKIFPSHDAYFREMNTELNMSGSFVDRNGSLHIDSGISKEDLREVMEDTIGGQPQVDIMFDVHGLTKRVTNGYNRTIIKKRSLT